MSVGDRDSNPELICNSGQITALLSRLQNTRALLTVRLPNSHLEYRSAVVSVDARRQRVTLDELHPPRGHDLIESGTTLQVTSRADGVATRFTLEVSSIGIEDGIYFYVARYPEALHYRQRRRAVRVPVRHALQEKAVLSEEHGQVEVRVENLSIGGVGGHVLRGGELTAGVRLEYELRLRDNAPWQGRLEICFARTDKLQKRQRFGARFLDLAPEESARLQKLVVALQRELIRST